jgi:hypothetical protein
MYAKVNYSACVINHDEVMEVKKTSDTTGIIHDCMYMHDIAKINHQSNSALLLGR